MQFILSTLSSGLFLAQSNSGGAGVAAGLGIFMIVVWALVLLATVFWIWMLIDCLTSPMPAADKVLWFLVIFFLHLLGALIYYLVKRSGPRSVTT